MAISRQVFELWKSVNREHGAAALFAPNALQVIKGRAEYQDISRKLEAKTDTPDVATLLALRTLSVMHQEVEDQLSGSELVITFPGGSYSTARPTYLVIRDMLRAAQTEVILAGYRITNEDILSLLHSARRRSLSVTLICSRQERDAERVLATWPSDAPRPVIYEDVERADDKALMHIKALLVDERDLLITSANFTLFAMERNFEFGIRTAGFPAREARKVLVELINSGSFKRLC